MGSRKQRSSLPNDVLFEHILIGLPAKQLAQMRCVSKTWNVVLSQPWFINSHLNRSIHNTDQSCVLIFKNRFSLEEQEGCKSFAAHHTRSPHLETTNLIKLPTLVNSNTSSSSSSVHDGSGNYIIIGSVNGLICFSSDYRSSKDKVVINIWNPSLSALLTIPTYNNDIDDHFSSDRKYCGILLRFGFDPKNDDYKVVKLKFCPGGMLVKAVWLEGVDVYSMNKGGWKSITERPPPHVSIFNNDNQACVDEHASTYCDGRLHWIGYLDDNYQVQTIVTFDLGLEVFGEISLPESATQSNYTNVVGVLEGKLCVMSSIRTGGDDRSYELWVMNNEYGKSSWVKNNVFSQVFTGNICLFGFTLNNELIFQPHNQPLALYDPLEAKVKSFNTRREFRTKIVSYVDSLVWVRRTCS